MHSLKSELLGKQAQNGNALLQSGVITTSSYGMGSGYSESMADIRDNNRILSNSSPFENICQDDKIHETIPSTMEQQGGTNIVIHPSSSDPNMIENRKATSVVGHGNSICPEEVFLWLDNHPGAFEDYFVNQATLEHINKWLLYHGYGKTFQEYLWADTKRSSVSGSSSYSSSSSSHHFPYNYHLHPLLAGTGARASGITEPHHSLLPPDQGKRCSSSSSILSLPWTRKSSDAVGNSNNSCHVCGAPNPSFIRNDSRRPSFQNICVGGSDIDGNISPPSNHTNNRTGSTSFFPLNNDRNSFGELIKSSLFHSRSPSNASFLSTNNTDGFTTALTTQHPYFDAKSYPSTMYNDMLFKEYLSRLNKSSPFLMNKLLKNLKVKSNTNRTVLTTQGQRRYSALNYPSSFANRVKPKRGRSSLNLDYVPGNEEPHYDDFYMPVLKNDGSRNLTICGGDGTNIATTPGKMNGSRRFSFSNVFSRKKSSMQDAINLPPTIKEMTVSTFENNPVTDYYLTQSPNKSSLINPSNRLNGNVSLDNFNNDERSSNYDYVSAPNSPNQHNNLLNRESINCSNFINSSFPFVPGVTRDILTFPPPPIFEYLRGNDSINFSDFKLRRCNSEFSFECVHLAKENAYRHRLLFPWDSQDSLLDLNKRHPLNRNSILPFKLTKVLYDISFGDADGRQPFLDCVQDLEAQLNEYDLLANMIYHTFPLCDTSGLVMTILMNASILTKANVARLYLRKLDNKHPFNWAKLVKRSRRHLYLFTPPLYNHQKHNKSNLQHGIQTSHPLHDKSTSPPSWPLKNEEVLQNRPIPTIPKSRRTTPIQFYLKAQFESQRLIVKSLNNNNSIASPHPPNKSKFDEETTFLTDLNINFNCEESSLVKECFTTGKPLNILCPKKHILYNSFIDGILDYDESDIEKNITSMLLVPLIYRTNGNSSGKRSMSPNYSILPRNSIVIGVIQVLNKGFPKICSTDAEGTDRQTAFQIDMFDPFWSIKHNAFLSKLPSPPKFTLEDEKSLIRYASFAAIAYNNALLFELSRKEFERNKAFLELLHNLYEEQINLEKSLMKIMKKVVWMLKCDKCKTVIQARDIETPNLINRKFELIEDDTAADHSRKMYFQSSYLKGSRNSLELNVLTSRRLSCQLPLIPKEQGKPSYPTVENSITAEILNIRKIHIGHIVAIDKLDNQDFDQNDVELLKIFAIFCGLVYDKNILYLQLADTNAMKSVALEVLSYHVRTSEDEVNRISDAVIKSAQVYDINNTFFDDYSLSDTEMIKAGIRMFIDAHFIEKFHIDYEVLCRWFLTTRKNYRKVLYHNWCHAFNVAQTMYCIMKNSTKISHTYTKLEWMTLLVACFSHDLDHRGLNNAYQTKTHSALEQLYGKEATMEYHHFNMAIMVLHTDGHNIFSGLYPEEYREVIGNLKIAILATDLSVHFRTRPKFFELCSNNTFDWTNSDHLKLLMGMLMSACDLSAAFKQWDIQRKAVDLVTSEFFTQGDLEKQILKITPNPEMDREKEEEIPKVQYAWLNNVCLPLYSNLAKLDPFFDDVVKSIEINRDTWIQHVK